VLPQQRKEVVLYLFAAAEKDPPMCPAPPVILVVAVELLLLLLHPDANFNCSLSMSFASGKKEERVVSRRMYLPEVLSTSGWP